MIVNRQEITVNPIQEYSLVKMNYGFKLPYYTAFFNAFLVLFTISAQSGYAQNNKNAGFDLASCTFTETIQSIDKFSGIKVSTKISAEKTLAGYERSESNSSELLNYNHSDLSGKFNQLDNKVIFHYKEKDGILGMYELRIYSAAQNNSLVKVLQTKIGVPDLERVVKDYGNGSDFKQTIWVKKDIIYFLLQELNKHDVKVSNLAVFKKNNTDFYTLLGTKGYAINPKVLIEEVLNKRK